MQLVIGTATSDRAFGRLLRKVLLAFQPLEDAFSRVPMAHAIYRSLIVGLSDDYPEGHFEASGHEDIFQIEAFCRRQTDAATLAVEVFGILKRAAETCPFSPTDRTAFLNVFRRFAEEVLKIDDARPR